MAAAKYLSSSSRAASKVSRFWLNLKNFRAGLGAAVICRKPPPAGPGVLARIDLRRDDEQVVWGRQAFFPIRQAHIAPNTKLTAEQSLHYLLPWEQAVEWLAQQELPPIIQNAEALRGYGESQITADGPRVVHVFVEKDPDQAAEELPDTDATDGAETRNTPDSTNENAVPRTGAPAPPPS